MDLTQPKKTPIKLDRIPPMQAPIVSRHDCKLAVLIPASTSHAMIAVPNTQTRKSPINKHRHGLVARYHWPRVCDERERES